MNKKIGILVPNLKDNGVSKVAALHSIMFSDSNYNVDIIIKNDDISFDYKGNLINLNIKKRKGFLKILNYIELFIKIRDLKKIKKYDYFISHIPHCDLINVLTKKKEKTITTVHNNIEERYSIISKILLYVTFSKADYVVPVSSELKNILQEKYKRYSNKFINIYNPININEINKKSIMPLPDILNYKKYILNVGRLDEQKGQWHLLKAFSLIENKHTDIDLVIIGKGPEEIRLKELAISLNIKNRVHFIGFQDNPYNIMKQAELFVFPSLYEGFPMVLIESMLCNLPIISSDCKTGPIELIGKEKYKYGVLIPDLASKNSLFNIEYCKFDKLLAYEIEFLLENKDIKQAIIEKAHIRGKTFSIENILSVWEEKILNINGNK